jgi:hypothetical protein
MCLTVFVRLDTSPIMMMCFDASSMLVVSPMSLLEERGQGGRRRRRWGREYHVACVCVCACVTKSCEKCVKICVRARASEKASVVPCATKITRGGGVGVGRRGGWASVATEGCAGSFQQLGGAHPFWGDCEIVSACFSRF